MKLSVILPCFNGAETIAVQLEALAKQRWSGSWELVFVNNGSTDNSVAIVEQYRDRFPKLKIVNAHVPPEPRKGVTHSYTVGMQAATGDAFVFCEADDEVAPGWLAAMGRALRKYEFVAGAHEYRRLNEPWLAKGMEPDRGLLWKKHMSPYPYSSGCKIGMRRSVYETVGRFDSDCKTSWDTDYCWRVQQAGIPLHFIPDAVISYRLTHKFVDRYRKGKLWGECDIILLKKHGNSSVGIRKIKTLILKGIQILLHLLKIPFFVWDKRAFGDWIWQLGWRIGEWRGYFKYLFLDRPIQQTRTAKTLKKSEGKALV